MAENQHPAETTTDSRGHELVARQAVRILPTAPGSGAYGIAVVVRVNASTVTVRRAHDGATVRYAPEHLLDAEVRLGLEVGTIAGDLLELDELEPELVVVVPCGARKVDHAAPAGELYTGPLFRSALRAAQALGGRTLILSALHGLVELDQELEPYNVRLGDAGSIDPDQVRAQALELGLDDARVVILGGRDYVELGRAAWPDAVAPLAGSAGLGVMRGRLGAIARGELEVAA